MPIYIGAQGKAGYKLETSYGTGGTPVTIPIPIISEDMRINIQKIASPALFGSRNTRTYYHGQQNPSGSITFMADPDNIATLLFLALGVEGNATQVLGTQAEITQVTCGADTAGSLSGKYFTINSPTVNYYVWYDVAGLGSIDPAIAGKTGIPVGISSGATASTVATATASAIDALAAFVSTPAAAVVTVTNAVAGAATDATAGTTGWATPTVAQQGSGGAAYDHVFTPAAVGVDLGSFALEIERGGTCCLYNGCVVNEIKFAATRENPLQCTLGLFAQLETDDQTATVLTPSTKIPYLFTHATVKLDTAAIAYVNSFELTYTNEVDADGGFVVNGTAYRAHCYKTTGLLTGSMELEWTSAADTFRDAYLDNTSMKLEFIFTSTEAIEAGYYYTMSIEIPIAKILGEPPVLSDRGRTPFTVNFEAIYDSTNYVKITHRDARSSKWSA
jgi:hypothetical protein